MKTLKVGTIVECKCPAGFSRANYKDRCKVESVGKFYTKLRLMDRNIVLFCFHRNNNNPLVQV